MSGSSGDSARPATEPTAGEDAPPVIRRDTEPGGDGGHDGARRRGHAPQCVWPQIDALPVGVVVCDSAGVIHEANAAACALVGVSGCEVIGSCCFDHPEWVERLLTSDGKPLDLRRLPPLDTLGDDRPFSTVVGIRQRDGQTVSRVVAHVRCVQDDQAPQTRLVITLTDVTPHEEDAHDTRTVTVRKDEGPQPDRLGAFLAAAYRCELHAPWHDEYLGSGIERLTGYPAERLVRGEVTWKEIIHPDDWRRVQAESVEAIAADVDEYEHEYRIRTREGETRRVWDLVRVVRTVDGAPVYLEGLLVDVTDRHKAEEALAEKERMLSTLLGNLPGMAFRCANDRDRTMHYVSDACETLTGYSPDGLVESRDASYGSLIEPQDRDVVWDTVQEALASRRPWTVTYRIRTASGGWKWVQERGVGVWSADDDLLALEGFVTDVTQGIETQRALEEREQQLSALMQNVPGMVFRCEPRPPWRDEFLSDGVYAITGYRPEEFLAGMVLYTDLVHPDDLAMLEAETERAIEDGRPWRVDYRIIDRAGRVKWVQERGLALRDADGRVTVLEGLITDITALVATRQDLERRERELALLVASTPGMVYRGAPTYPWRDFFVSEGALELTGYTPAELMSPDLTYEDLVVEEDRHWSDELMERALETRSPWALEYRIRTKDGEVKWVSERGAWVTDETGEIVAVQGLITDVTEIKRVQEHLAAQQRMLTTLLGNVPGVVYRSEVEAPWRAEFVGEGHEALTGHTAAQAVAGEPAYGELIHPEDVPLLERETRRAIEERRPADVEYRITTADGTEKWVWDRFVVVRDEDDRPVALEGLLIDVTDRHVAEQALAASRAELDLHARIATMFLTSAQDSMFSNVVDVICEATASRWGFFGFIGEDGSLVAPSMNAEVWSACEVPNKTLRFPANDWGDNTWSRALRSGVTQRLDHPGKVPEGHLPIDRALAVPVTYRGDTIGIILVANKPQRYHEEDVRLVESVATYIGPVLHHWLQRAFEERARRAAEDALRESEQRYRALYEKSPVGVFIYDGEATMIDCNEAFLAIVQAPRRELVGRCRPRFMTGPLWPAIESSLHGTQGFYEGPCEACAEGVERYVTLTTAPRLHADGAVLGGIGVLVDRTAQKRAEEQMHHLLVHDSLTGLPNRSLFMDRVQQALARARRHRLGFAVAVIELDRFADLRETLGHEACDKLLLEAARRFTAPLREEDTVARTGGQQFALLLPGVDGPGEATVVIETLVRTLGEPMRTDGHELYLSASVGVAVYPADGADGEELVRNAEVAAHRALDQGGHQWQFYHASMNAERAERLRLEADLHRALEHDQFVLFYQPELDATSWTVTGVEALLRWQHPERGLLAPLDFIPVLEEAGLMNDVGTWVLHEACRQVSQWNRCGLRPMRLGLNLSATQFRQHDITEVIAAALEQAELPPELLEVEITESVALRDPVVTARVLTRLKRLGVRVALDDFGTGYSSLSHVARLPITTVKIDRSFVRGVARNAVHAAVVSSVITLAHRLGLDVVAEGVETEAEQAFLRDERCDVLQGFAFSKPLPAAKLTAFLQDMRGRRGRSPRAAED